MSLSMFAKRVTMLVFQCDVDNAVLVGATTLPRKDEDSRVALRHYGRTEDHMSRHQVLAPEDGSLDPRAAGAKDERARADRLGGCRASPRNRLKMGFSLRPTASTRTLTISTGL